MGMIFDTFEEESSALLLRMMFDRFDPYEEESSTSFTGGIA